jgi:hypothetical protein
MRASLALCSMSEKSMNNVQVSGVDIFGNNEPYTSVTSNPLETKEALRWTVPSLSLILIWRFGTDLREGVNEFCRKLSEPFSCCIRSVGG